MSVIDHVTILFIYPGIASSSLANINLEFS